MTKAIARDPIYRGRRFQSETIELCVRWYITYRLSYGDLVAMMAERGIAVSHTTIMRWVLRCVPEFEKRWARYARRVNSSWRIDETSIPVRGRWHYLYRAVDKYGKSVGHLLRADRGIDAAQAFFRKPQQHRRAGPPRHQTSVRGDAGLPVIRNRGHHARWRRARASHSQTAVLARSRPSAPRLVAEAAVGSSSGVEWSSGKNERFCLHDRHCTRTQMLTDSRVRSAKPLRAPRKLFDGRGLYLLVAPNGGRYWRYNYRFNGKQKTLALWIYPDVSLAKARARHQKARRQLADGIDPSIKKQASGKTFEIVPRE